MSELTSGAIRVLGDIHKRGLIVLYSFHTPHPEYMDTGEEFPASAWRIIQRELLRYKTAYPQVKVGQDTVEIERQHVKGGILYLDFIIVANGEEFIARRDMQGVVGGEDVVISESTTSTATRHRVQFQREVAGYINRVQIDMDEYFEEFVGLKFQYTLTEKALAALDESRKEQDA